jgi:hypothetical protein
MRTMPRPSDTIDVAQETLRMDRQTGDKTFRLLAIGMMCVTALATGVHALHGLCRDVRGRREARDYGRGDWRSRPGADEPEYSYSAKDGAAGRYEESDSERRWSRREEHRGRSSEGDERSAQYGRERGEGRAR